MERKTYGTGAARVYGLLIDPLVAKLRPKITQICQQESVASALDIACATGAQCRTLARAGMRATGLDLSESMIQAARRRGAAGTEFVLGSALELPFPDGAFDAAILSLALHEHPEEERAGMLCEALRVVHTGGVLLLADYTRPRCPRLHPAWAVVRFVEHIAGGEHRAGFLDFMNRGGLDGLLSRHGLKKARTAQSHFGTLGIAVVRRASRT